MPQIAVRTGGRLNYEISGEGKPLLLIIRATAGSASASLAEDASALLEALEIPRAHTLGWSLGDPAGAGPGAPGAGRDSGPGRHLGGV